MDLVNAAGSVPGVAGLVAADGCCPGVVDLANAADCGPGVAGLVVADGCCPGVVDLANAAGCGPSVAGLAAADGCCPGVVDLVNAAGSVPGITGLDAADGCCPGVVDLVNAAVSVAGVVGPADVPGCGPGVVGLPDAAGGSLGVTGLADAAGGGAGVGGLVDAVGCGLGGAELGTFERCTVAGSAPLKIGGALICLSITPAAEVGFCGACTTAALATPDPGQMASSHFTGVACSNLVVRAVAEAMLVSSGMGHKARPLLVAKVTASPAASNVCPGVTATLAPGRLTLLLASTVATFG